MTRSTDHDVLEQNVSTLLESGGEPPKLADTARARIRAELIAKHGVAPAAPKVRVRTPLIAVGFGLAATAATALVVSRFVGDEPAAKVSNALADGTTYIVEPGSKVTVIGSRRVRVEGTALLDVAPGKGTFIVETARGRIEVLGTRFVVDANAQRTTTAVVRGQVKLIAELGSVLLHAGEQAVAEVGKAPVRGPAPRLSHLTSWAKSLRHREEGTPEPVRHGSLFARDPGMRPNGQFGEEYPLPIKQLTVDVVVEDQVARVALDQTFHNPSTRVLEGVYKFAIPPDAALQRLAMYVDGTLMESAVVERQQARRIYEELVYRRVDPALLEYAGTGRLNLRVYPLPAQQDKRLMVAYTQSVAKLYSDWTLAIPLPEVDQPVGEINVSARIKGCANCELTSPSHPIKVDRAGEDAVVSYKRAADKIGDTFVVHVRDSRKQPIVASASDGGDQYMMVRAPAELAGIAREYRPRTWVILDDVSASRSELELKAQADLVDAFLRELDEDDKVSLVAFDVEARQKLAPTRVNDVDRRVVRQMLKDEGGVGATDFGKALDVALRTLAGTKPEDAMIVYLGDGVITSGPRQLDALRAQLAGKAQFIGVGVGDGPDTETLGALAAATGGFTANIDLADDLRWRAFDLIAALHTSRVTGLSAKLVDAQGALVPSTTYLRSPQLADGEEIEVIGKLAGTGTPAFVELTGTRNGAPWQQRIALGAPRGEAGYLPRLWAQHHIAARMLAKHDAVIVPPCTPQAATRTQDVVACPTEAQLRQTRDEEIRKEIVTLGKQYFLLSRHTSLLVLENDAMYAKYGVRKGAGDTWAPYAMPAKIAVAKVAGTPVLANVADDAELVRTPLQIFYDAGGGYDEWGGEDLSGGLAFDALLDADQAGFGRFGTIGQGQGFGVGGGRRARTEEAERSRTRGALGITAADVQSELRLPRQPTENPFGDFRGHFEGKMGKTAAGPMKKSGGSWQRQTVTTRELQRGLFDFDRQRERSMWRNRSQVRQWGVAALSPARFTHPTDTAYDDVTALVPALVPDISDVWRAQLAETESEQPYPIDPAAQKLLAEARRNLQAGTYKWGEREIVVDAARRFGWRRTTDAGLDETAAYDGKTWTRRYRELGLSVTRAVAHDDIALAFGHLPVWIAEPAHYARYFVVGMKGPRAVTLSIKTADKDVLAFTLTFDDQARLVSIHDAEGAALLQVTWGGAGPASAQLGDETIAVGYTATTVADAPAWAHGDSQAGVGVTLPARMPGYWQAQLTALGPDAKGTPAWRDVQRQMMVSAAALGDRQTLARVYDELRTNGGVELGDLALASGGIATATTDAQLADALAPLAKQPLARYLVAGRAYGKDPRPARIAPETRDGFIGALWTLRSATALLAGDKKENSKLAVDQLLALGDRAFTLRLVGAAIVAQRYYVDVADVVRAVQPVAVGDYKNVVRAQIAHAQYRLGKYDAAAEQVAALATELDLAAKPPRIADLQYAFNYSRRGPAGWQIVYAQWRDRVLAGTSFPHVMAMMQMAAQHPADLPAVLARAVALAGDDLDRKLAVAHVAQQYGQLPMARSLVESMVKDTPSREVFQLAARMATAEGRKADALKLLEQAQDAGADEAVDVAVVRNEIGEIIGLAHQLAVQSRGAERDAHVARALAWGKRWRMIDPGNADIDRRLGDLLLATGDTAGAWRQLSSAIERDPWASSGYTTVAESFERQGRVADALELWQQAIVIDQTNPTPRLRKAQALFALGRNAEGDALLEQITTQKWHDVWNNVVYQAKNLVERAKQQK